MPLHQVVADADDHMGSYNGPGSGSGEILYGFDKCSCSQCLQVYVIPIGNPHLTIIIPFVTEKCIRNDTSGHQSAGRPQVRVALFAMPYISSIRLQRDHGACDWIHAPT